MRHAIVTQMYSAKGFSLTVKPGIRIYHKKLDVTVECDKYKSDHKNRADCEEQLRAMIC